MARFRKRKPACTLQRLRRQNRAAKKQVTQRLTVVAVSICLSRRCVVFLPFLKLLCAVYSSPTLKLPKQSLHSKSAQEISSVIRVRNLVKTFGSFTAVNAVSFDVAEGEIFAFLGPNGAGKTTTIKMLTTLLKPTSGSMELDGLDPKAGQNEIRKRFGIVFQDPS